jgi:hypothetical protein
MLGNRDRFIWIAAVANYNQPVIDIEDGNDASVNGDDSDPGHIVDPRGSSAVLDTDSYGEPAIPGIQYMITNKMRQALEDELGYLTEEVDCMEPQVAAVVIEKRLPRPTNGMPSSWARSGTVSVPSAARHHWSLTSGIGRSIRAVGSATRRVRRGVVYALSPLKPPAEVITRIGKSTWRSVRKWTPVLIPVVSAAYLTPYLLRQLSDPDSLLSATFESVKGTCSGIINHIPFIGQRFRRRERKPTERIDMRTLNVVRKLSWRDRLSNMFSSE